MEKRRCTDSRGRWYGLNRGGTRVGEARTLRNRGGGSAAVLEHVRRSCLWRNEAEPPRQLLGLVAGSGAGDFAWLAFLQRRPGRPHRRPGFAYPLRVPSASDGETATCGSAAASARPRKFLRGTRCFGPFGSGHNVLRVTCWAFKGPSSETLITHLSPLYTYTPGAGTAGRPPAACVLRLVPAARGLILVFAIAIRSIRILCFSLVACRCARFLLVLSL